MTTRDATEGAISAVLNSGIPVHQADIAAVINAIPDAFLVDLAIERGELTEYNSWRNIAGEEVTLYRLVAS